MLIPTCQPEDSPGSLWGLFVETNDMKPTKLSGSSVLTVLSTVILSTVVVQTMGLSICPVLAQSANPMANSAVNLATNSMLARVADPLKAGDRIQLVVVSFPDLSGEQLIGADGTIQIPLAGAIAIGGLTSAQATERITQVLLPYVRRPQVGLTILSLSPLHVSVTGEVIQPGARSLPLVDDRTDNYAPVTLSSVLLLAGGITPYADLRNIVIRRTIQNEAIQEVPAEAGTAVGNQPVLSLAALTETTRPEVKVDLWQVIQSGDLANDLRIYDGDEIVVPRVQTSTEDQQTLLTSTVAPAKVTVRVVGEVQNPGEIEIAPIAGISGAVAAAGGPTDDASTDDIILLRMSPQGQLEQKAFAFEAASEPLVNGDLILVDESSRGDVGNAFDFLGRLFLPISPFLRLF